MPEFRNFMSANWTLNRVPIPNLEKVAYDKVLERIKERGHDLRKFFMSEAKPLVVAEVKKSFKTESGPFGSWPGLKASTIDRKARKVRTGERLGPKRLKAIHGPEIIGRQTDLMYKAATVEGAYGNLSKMTGKEFSWGIDANKIPYAESFAIGRGTQPARAIRFDSPSLRKKIETALRSWFGREIYKIAIRFGIPAGTGKKGLF